MILSSTPSPRSNITNYAFADDLAITTHHIAHIYPALSLISTFSSISGLGINRDKSLVLSTSHPSKLAAFRTGLSLSPWPDLPLKGKGTHLGVVIGRLVTLEDIWETPVTRALTRIKASRPFVKSLSLPNRILYVNVSLSLFFPISVSFISFQVLFGNSSRVLSPNSSSPSMGVPSHMSLLCVPT